ncbi:hypothetical protein B5T_04133 [Alloalcanivorax dieselolei B5]|uniref:Gamma-butyrobetaine hydroxylase-like N-terminal domain-containing protein n=1 Tax=Alcanivorax dieselolei (strain DSM 16502 / CGMCC 1.3690 / MCCC 1A00001 / B-5) TaxID=930169 RepID=K0CID2_ALCDB|nr:DUF971 domain-containing protein [Alloalcanivorax dieselolei]AFT72393.1 hypothetical protein B5T_04133 [Alloalcanivorax dieselolei B5]GGJ77561.1 hypothetical protein GCM10007426_03170 [Alloalcanivorax dieselolei]
MMTYHTELNAPEEIHLRKGGRTLQLIWENGEISRLTSTTLRRACRCAHCEAARRRRTDPADGDITIQDVAMADLGALQLTFSDGHDRGRFPWNYLYRLGDSAEAPP